MLPKDEGVRTAIDPFPNKRMSKAEAVISITGKRPGASF